jgi:3-methyladenine DNA glycosylase AlkD
VITVEKILAALHNQSSSSVKSKQEYFGVKGVNSYGLTTPQLRAIAKEIGTNQTLALQLWKTGIHEARHIAIFIADPKHTTEEGMEQWLKDFNSWDIVDNCCTTLFKKSPLAYEKATEWTGRENEFEKRAGFVMMAVLAVHDKKADDKKFERFFPYLLHESHDERNFVKKANNWAIRQIGKRNERLCKKAIVLSKKIQKKGDAASRWIAAGALRELEKYCREGKIKATAK